MYAILALKAIATLIALSGFIYWIASLECMKEAGLPSDFADEMNSYGPAETPVYVSTIVNTPIEYDKAA